MLFLLGPSMSSGGTFSLGFATRETGSWGRFVGGRGREISVRLPPVAPEIYCAYDSNLAAELALLLHSLVRRISHWRIKVAKAF
jgi:hypothetical protein